MKKTTSEMIEELKAKGFKDIFIWSDSKGTYYDWHKHPYDEIRVMLKGEMIINTKENQYHLKAGDVLNVPAGEVHEAYVLEDCEYICGSKY
ncbi:cupin domain-containing protein [Caminibacter pacificus]|uniref:Cupin domain n=2 Tax=Caminibacter pacificus TaxID=1424653 RepID=A0AAJ4UXQ1_9BACT|nr:cupin domain-containing protein [Caminibacter pacificus]ROR39890.1 cupin domain [Caminibacter pacificus]